MAKSLPIVSSPTIVLTLPLSQKKIKYRPFINKEKKAILLSKEAGDWDSTIETLRDVILSCTNGDVDIKEIPMCDSAYLFVQLRIQSIGNVISATTECQNEECKEKIQLNYDLNSIKVDTSSWKPEVPLTENVGVIFKAPTFDDMKYASGESKDTEKFIISMIDSIYDENEVHQASEHSYEELVAWMDTLNDAQMKKIIDFLDSIPTLKQEIKYSCPKCGHKHEINLEGFADFF